MAHEGGDLTVRRINASEGLLLRDLRLRSLADAPEAFGQSVAEAAARPVAEWHQSARMACSGERRAWFLAESGSAVLGIVQGRRRPPDTLLVFSMWVDPAGRRCGIGRRLIEVTEAWAAGWGGRETVLWVFASNNAAVRFYVRLGFLVDLEGPDAATGAGYGALSMRRPITRSTGGA